MATPNLIVNGTSIGPIDLVPLGGDLYRFNEPFFWEFFAESEEELATLPNPGDVILTKPGSEGDLEFVRVQRRGEFKVQSFVLDERDVQNPALTALLRQVGREGGSWERVMGGFLTVALPPGSTMDFSTLLAEALRGA
jgi:hypothetical protein